jgi:hypothetical protein
MTPFDHQIFELALRAVMYASVLHMILPPYETFKQLPRFQAIYKAVVDTVGWIALNGRGKVIQAYPSMKQPGDSPAPPADGQGQ